MDLEQIIREQGFEFHRRNKHKIYKRGDGKTFVTACTPSDRRYQANAISDLARILGVPRRELLKPKERVKNHQPLEPLEPLASHPECLPVSIPALPTPLSRPFTKQERSKLKRWEKHWEEKRARHALLRKRLEHILTFLSNYVVEGQLDPEEASLGLWAILKEEHLSPKKMAVEIKSTNGDKVLGVIPKVGPFHLSLLSNSVHAENLWKVPWIQGTTLEIEVWGELEKGDKL